MVKDVAIFFLTKSSMSQKKLQKLVYYAYAWTLTLLNEDENSLDFRLFEDGIQAWVHGPVCPELYAEYKSYGWSDIPRAETSEICFDSEVEDILEQVWDVYGDYSGNELESLTHQEKPWISARSGYAPSMACKVELDDKLIYSYYNERIASDE